ncbi:MAG: hypothetical protein AB8B55_00605 [Mariniblastus sp.]
MSGSSRSMKSRSHFNYECFEPRRMLAGDVKVVQWDGNLFIRGDAEANQIQLVANENDQLKIVGTGGTTINSGSEFVVSGSSGLNDSSSATTQFAGGLRLNLGQGNDSLEVVGTQFRGHSVIYGGPGNDTISLSKSSFHDHLTVQTFDGDDNISIKQSEFLDDLYVFSLDGADTVDLQNDLTQGHAIVFTGNHSDHVMIENSEFMGNTQLVLTGDGDDVVEVLNPNVGENGFGIYAGHGSDHVTAVVEDATLSGKLTLSGQQGRDVGSMTMDTDATDEVFAIGFEANGELVFDGPVGGPENVEQGVDSIALEGSPIKQHYATPINLDSTQTIKSVEWTGIYERDFEWNRSPDRGDSFVIEIYEDAGDGAPDSSTTARFEVGGANRVDNGERNEVRSSTEVLYEYPIYEYSADIEYTMEAGKQYWISIFTELDQIEFAEQNIWKWGMATSFFAETLMTQGQEDGRIDSDWRRGGEPNRVPNTQTWLEMDVRLRT